MAQRPAGTLSRVAAVSAAALAIAMGAAQPARAIVDNHLTHVSVGIGGAQPDGDNGGSSALSADGRYVVFVSSSTNLTPGVPPTGGLANLYVRDTVAGSTRLVSHKPDGTANNLATGIAAISADGRYVAYTARVGMTSPGIQLRLWDRDTDKSTTISKTPAGEVTKSSEILPAISADGSRVVYTMRTAPPPDLTVHVLLYSYEVATDTTTQLAGGELVYPMNSPVTRPSISGDGRFVAFVRLTPTQPDGRHRARLVRLNIATGAERAAYTSLPEFYTLDRSPSLSSNGRDLAFVDGNHVSVHDFGSGTTDLVTAAYSGGPADGASSMPSISGDGRYVSFLSSSTNLLAQPVDGVGTYVRDRQTGTTERFGTNLQGVYPGADPNFPRISANGNAVVFSTYARGLSVGANTVRVRVYLWTRPAA
jgi:Tol biopolymer transport system component